MKAKQNFFGSDLPSNPHLAHIVMRTLAVAGPLREDDLRTLVQPVALTDGGDGPWKATMSVLSGIGVVSSGPIHELLVHFEVPADGSVDPRAFQSAFGRQLVVHSRHAVENGGESGGEPSDLSQGLLWLSMLTGREVFKDYEGARADLIAKKLHHAVPNSVQWSAFRRWATALGVQRNNSVGCVADYLGAMRRALEGQPREMTINTWLAAFSELLPSLHDPVLKGWYESTYGGRDVSGLEGTFSMAILRLEANGEIELTMRDDVGNAVNLQGDGRSVSHVAKVMSDE